MGIPLQLIERVIMWISRLTIAHHNLTIPHDLTIEKRNM